MWIVLNFVVILNFAVCLLQWVVNTVDTQLDAAAGELFSGLKQTLWAAIDEEINLQDCEIYR